MKLTTPTPITPGTCDWHFNRDGYTCSEASGSGFPTLDEDGAFKWVRMCQTHREMLMVKSGEMSSASFREIQAAMCRGEGQKAMLLETNPDLYEI